MNEPGGSKGSAEPSEEEIEARWVQLMGSAPATTEDGAATPDYATKLDVIAVEHRPRRVIRNWLRYRGLGPSSPLRVESSRAFMWLVGTGVLVILGAVVPNVLVVWQGSLVNKQIEQQAQQDYRARKTALIGVIYDRENCDKRRLLNEMDLDAWETLKGRVNRGQKPEDLRNPKPSDIQCRHKANLRTRRDAIVSLIALEDSQCLVNKLAKVEGIDLNNKSASHPLGPDERSCRHWVDLAGADLRSIGSREVSLREVDFRSVYLQEAHLERAWLASAHLEGVNLEGAHLEGAYLGNAHLERAALFGIHMQGARLASAHLEGAHLMEADLKGALLLSAHLEGTVLNGANLEGAVLVRSYLEGADLSQAYLAGANLSNARLEGAIVEQGWLKTIGSLEPPAVGIELSDWEEADCRTRIGYTVCTLKSRTTAAP